MFGKPMQTEREAITLLIAIHVDLKTHSIYLHIPGFDIGVYITGLDHYHFCLLKPNTIIPRNSHANESTPLSQVGLYISASTPPDSSLLSKLVTLGINQLFVEPDVGLTEFRDARITRCQHHDASQRIDGETAVISEVSPMGAILAGSHGLPLVSTAATTPGGFNALAANWELYERKARQRGHSAHRSNWSLVAPMHLANTRRKAVAEVEQNLPIWLSRHPGLKSLLTNHVSPAQALVNSGFAVIGSRRDARSQILRLAAATGGFGNLLLLLHDWAGPEATYHSLKLCVEVTDACPTWHK